MEPVSNSDKPIAIFGLSANPPTGLSGHQGIVRHLGKFSEIWILPVYRHIYKDMSGAVSFDHRFKMSELCFLGESEEKGTKVIVKRLEEELCLAHPETRIGTIDILRYVAIKYTKDIYLVLGKDTFRDLACGKWKEYNTIPEYCRLLVFERSEVNSQYLEDPKYQSFCEIHKSRMEHTLIRPRMDRVSSTALREEECDGANFNNSEWIHPDVAKYISRNSLYKSRSLDWILFPILGTVSILFLFYFVR